MKKSAILIGASVLLAAQHVAADIVQNDDVIITFSLCVGNDCVNGENFGFDTLRLKENNLRIHFQDTSATASFPGNDWRIVANDSSNGGSNYLAIEDVDAGAQIFRVDAGAPANSLRVDGQGDVGIGTASAVTELHIKDGDSPTIRLEQDGSSGFTAQTWDLAGNETNFFIRDVTNGSNLPFRIRPGAPTSSLDIGADGTVSIINSTAKLKLDGNAGDWELVSRSDGEFAINDVSTTGADFLFKTADTAGNTAWEFVHRADNGLGFNISTSTGADMILSNAGNLTVLGTVTTGGPTCGGGCDAVFDPEYDLPSIEEHAELMFANKHLPTVGPTSPDKPVNLTEYVGNMLNELEKAHIYIAELNKDNMALEQRLRKLEQEPR